MVGGVGETADVFTTPRCRDMDRAHCDGRARHRRDHMGDLGMVRPKTFGHGQRRQVAVGVVGILGTVCCLVFTLVAILLWWLFRLVAWLS